MKELLELLGEEMYTQVMAKMNGHKLIIDTGDLVPKKDWIPKTVMAEKETKWKEQLEERTTEMSSVQEKLKAAEGQPEKLAEIQKLMVENEAKFKENDKRNKSELDKALKTHAVELTLKDADCMHSDLLVPKVDLSSVVLIDGKYVVPEAVVTGLKEKYKENFGKITPHGDPSPKDPDNPSPKQANLVELNKSLKDAMDKGDSNGAVAFRRLITEAEKAQRK